MKPLTSSTAGVPSVPAPNFWRAKWKASPCHLALSERTARQNASIHSPGVTLSSAASSSSASYPMPKFT